MANPISINTGSTNVSLNFGTIDNSITVYLDPDNLAPGSGWAKVFDFQTGYMGAPNPNCTVDISPLLARYKSTGSTTATLTFVACNYSGGGSINFKVQYPGGTTPVSTNLPTYTAQMWSYTLKL